MSAAEKSAAREGELTTGGQRFRYREAGTGPVLLCLGGAEPRSPTRALLAERYRVIELLLPERAPGAAPSASQAVRQAIASLGIARFDLLAHGAQDALALSLALDHPDIVSALVLLGPTAITRNGEPAHGVDTLLIGRLGELKVPSLAVFGTKDSDAPVEAARHYRSRMPLCNLVYVYDASHAMEEERPEAVAALLFDFLERHDLFLVRRDSDLLYP